MPTGTIVFVDPSKVKFTKARRSTNNVAWIRTNGTARRRTWDLFAYACIKFNDANIPDLNGYFEAREITLTAAVMSVLEDRTGATLYIDQIMERSVRAVLSKNGSSVDVREKDGVELKKRLGAVNIPILVRRPRT